MSDKNTREGDVVLSDHDKEKLLSAVRILTSGDGNGNDSCLNSCLSRLGIGVLFLLFIPIIIKIL